MDGVMFDTERIYEEAFAAIAKTLGYEQEVSEEFIKGFKSNTKKVIKLKCKALLDELSLQRTGKEFDADEYIKQVLAYLYECIENRGIPIKNGLFELLQYARENNIKTAIGTSENSERVIDYLDKAGISENTFGAIICGDMVQNGKPEPDIFLRACEELSVRPEEAIILEDSLNGIIAAYRAGAKPIMVVDCIEPTDEIRSMLFVEPLNSLVEVQEMLEKKVC